MIINHLLPYGSTLLEKRAAAIMREAVQNPIIIADLINPEKCPEKLLPYLAWALSVDRWEEEWSEEVKRTAIKSAYYIHQTKGTIKAVTRVIEPIGYLVSLTEWFNETPPGEPGTFSLTVEVPEAGLNSETYNELMRLINDAKPVSRHIKTLAIAISPTGIINAFIGQQSGEIITVYQQE